MLVAPSPWYPLRPSMVLVASRPVLQDELCAVNMHRTAVEVTSGSGSSLHYSAEQTSDKKPSTAAWCLNYPS